MQRKKNKIKNLIMTKTIYLDNAATTKVDDEVVKAMLPYFSEKYGNASSQHIMGQEAKRAIEEARELVAKSIGAKQDEIIFTSGGTEANNFTLKGLFFAYKEQGKNHIITSKIEHDCILNTCKWLENMGAKITYLDVDSNGFIYPEQVKNAITKETLVVSIIHANNEIGTIQNLEEIGKVCKEKAVFFHTDACQSYTKVAIDVNKMNLDFVTLNSHKIHGPKGVGALYIRKSRKSNIFGLSKRLAEEIKLVPLLHGGGHEYGLRSTTENVPGIVGFAKAVQIANSSNIKHMIALREKLIEGLLKIPNTNINGPRGDKRLCNNINVRFNNIEGEAIGGFLDSYNICSSTGSACSSHSLESSHVLKSIGLDYLEMNSSIRLSLSKYNTNEDIIMFSR
jgi:cysteine desulfurase